MSDNKKKVIITAGCGGIGAELAKYLLQQGYLVIPTTRTAEHKKAFLDTLDPEIKKSCHPMLLHLDSQEEIDKFILQVKKDVNRIDALINCAVCRDLIENYYEMNIENWDRHYRINVFGTSYISAKTAEELICVNGAIVNISSFYSTNIPDNRIYDENTIPTSLIYASSKAALNYVTQYMAVKYAEQNISVNAILAGGVENCLKQGSDFVKNYCYRTPMKRMAHIDDFNYAAEFFISEQNRYCTGQLLSIDGGWGLL